MHFIKHGILGIIVKIVFLVAVDSIKKWSLVRLVYRITSIASDNV